MFTYPNEVKGSCNHNNTGASFLPNHSPKITNRIFCWTLSYNIGLGLNKTLKNRKSMMNYQCILTTRVRGREYALTINIKLFNIFLSGCALCKNHTIEILGLE